MNDSKICLCVQELSERDKVSIVLTGELKSL